MSSTSKPSTTEETTLKTFTEKLNTLKETITSTITKTNSVQTTTILSLTSVASTTNNVQTTPTLTKSNTGVSTSNPSTGSTSGISTPKTSEISKTVTTTTKNITPQNMDTSPSTQTRSKLISSTLTTQTSSSTITLLPRNATTELSSIKHNYTLRNLTLPKENMLNISYNATTSHHWYFNNKMIYDYGSNDNFLIAELKIRYPKDYDTLKDYFPASQDLEYFRKVGEKIIPDEFTMDSSIIPGGLPSLSFPGNGKCLELFSISSDHSYNRQCLSELETCEYGFSVALWIKYNEDTMRKKEIFMASGPDGTQGFEFSYELGQIVVQIKGRNRSWKAQMPMIKYIRSWLIIGFSWLRFTGHIMILVGDKFVTFSDSPIVHNLNYSSSTNVYLGCLKQLSGNSDPLTTPRISISHVAMWMYPVRKKEILASVIVYKLIKFDIPPTTTTAMPVLISKLDFSKEIKELTGKTTNANPFYSTSDAYFSVSNVVFTSNTIEIVNTQRTGFKLLNRASHVSLSKPINFIKDCPCILSACKSGLSLSFWLLIPSGVNDGDIFVIVNSIRIVYVQNSLIILVYNGEKIAMGKKSSNVTFNVWQNYGFSIDANLKDASIYINGYLDNSTQDTTLSNYPLPHYSKNVDVTDIIIGSGSNYSLVGAIINDIAIWRKYSFPFESHRFVGYTSSQFKQLNMATNYWTTDQYINFDSSFQSTARSNENRVSFLPPVSLSTILKPTVAEFIMEMDPFSKSDNQCPVLQQKTSNYLFLGRSKMLRQTYTDSDINWSTSCLTDPTNTDCRSGGISVSMWMKIKSVSFNKIQFFLNTGDLGDYFGQSDGRGISIFVNQKLFGISLSTSEKDWDIIVDSNKYKTDEWMNIGLLWREDIGLQLLLNGIDYGLINISPNQRVKPRDAGFRAVIGRFDSDDPNSWSNQNIWEFSNFVFGEMSYFATYMTPDQYSSIIDLVNNVYYSDATWIREGAALINPPIKDLIMAQKMNKTLSYQGVIEWDNVKKAVRIISARIPIFTCPTGCPANLKACSSGFSIGAWFLMTEMFMSTITDNYTLFIQGHPNSDGFGVKIINKQDLYGWVQISRSLWKVVVSSKPLIKNKNEWVHIGLIWEMNNGVSVIINGNSYSNNSPVNTSDVPTNSPDLYIGDSSTTMSSKNNFLVYNLVFYNYSLVVFQLPKLLGIQYNQVALFSRSSLFWTVFGLYYKLIQTQVNMVATKYSSNKYDTNNAAICTNGADQSYIELTAGAVHCLNDPSLCQSFALIINIQLYPLALPGQTEGYILLSGYRRLGYTGVTIFQTSANVTLFEIRDVRRTCVTKITGYPVDTWIQLQLIWSRDNNPIVKINDVTNAAAINATCNIDDNLRSQKSSIVLGKNPNMFSSANQICISEIMLMCVEDKMDPENATKGMYDSSCYANMDLMFRLNQNAPDQYGMPDHATYFKNAVINTSLGDTCLNNPRTCSGGLTMSLWVFINSITGSDVVLVNVGRETKRGIGIRLQNNAISKGFDLLVSLETGTNSWTMKHPSAVSKAVWTNIGVTWSVQGGLTLFINGRVSKMSGTPSASTMADPTLATTIDIGKQIDGSINDLVVWFSVVASCVNPQNSHKVLNGRCSPDSTIPLQQKCSFIQDCENITGNLCMDETPNNVIQLSQLPMILTSPNDGNLVLEIANRVLKKSNANPNLTTAATKLLMNAASNMVIPESLTRDAAITLTDAFVSVNAELMLDKYMDDWKVMQKQNVYTAASVIKETDKFYLKVANKLKVVCVPVSNVRINLGVSLLSYNSGNTLCSSINLPNYVDTAWSSYPSIWTGSSNSFTIDQKTIQNNQPVISVSSSIYNGINVMPADSNNSIPANLVVNSQLITINTLPEFNRNIGQHIVNINLKFIKQNIRPGIRMPWDNVEPKNPDLKYQWAVAFWNDSLQLRNNSSGAWDANGLRLTFWNSTNVEFSSDHFTSFAVLMQPVINVPDYMQTLNIMTYVGLGISLICLLIFIITIAASKTLRGIRYAIHLNMSCSLFIACFAFILIGPAQQNQIFCRAVGVMMHLFFLSTFTWMFFEALFVFYAITSGNISNRLRCFYPLGWGIPMIIVITTISLDIDSYGRNTYCWLSQVNYYLWAFLGPVLILIVSTVIICLIVACNLATPAIKGDLLVESRDNIKQTAFTIPLMLLAWIFGLIWMVTMDISVAFLFVILCSLQGLWVLIFFGLLNPDFRYALCRKIRKRERPGSAIKILDSIETEYGSQTNVQEARTPRPPSKVTGPVYYVQTPKSRPPRHVDSVESSHASLNSQRNLINKQYDEETDELQTATIQSNSLPQNYTRSIPGTPQYNE